MSKVKVGRRRQWVQQQNTTRERERESRAKKFILTAMEVGDWTSAQFTLCRSLPRKALVCPIQWPKLAAEVS